MTYKLLGVGTNAKTIKGDGDEYLTAILYMTPYKVMVDGKLFNSCSMAAMASCIEGCLYTAGRGAFNNVQTARQRKAEWFYRDRDSFMAQLVIDVAKFANYCRKRNIQPCIRLNGTTDIRWELILIDGKNIFERFPDVQWYDYTKIPNRKVSHLANYHLTWSYSAANPKYEQYFDEVIRNGMSVAVVFRKPINLNTWRGYKVVDGDKDDLRFLDPKQSIVALYAKGKAKKDQSGFVVDIAA
jgi:hypothetical protein